MGYLPLKTNGWNLEVYLLKEKEKHDLLGSSGSFSGVCIWVFPKIGVLQNGWFIMNNLLKWMICGHHYFRKHPYTPFTEIMATNMPSNHLVKVLPYNMND